MHLLWIAQTLRVEPLPVMAGKASAERLEAQFAAIYCCCLKSNKNLLELYHNRPVFILVRDLLMEHLWDRLLTFSQQCSLAISYGIRSLLSIGWSFFRKQSHKMLLMAGRPQSRTNASSMSDRSSLRLSTDSQVLRHFWFSAS